jgi:hypothetical protein
MVDVSSLIFNLLGKDKQMVEKENRKHQKPKFLWPGKFTFSRFSNLPFAGRGEMSKW